MFARALPRTKSAEALRGDFCSGATQISAALKSGDLKLAERIAPTVKGVAGNIGIAEVQSVAQKLEKALNDGEGKNLALLVEFAGLMISQVHAIEKALRDSATARPEELRLSPFNEEAVAGAIARLRTLLEVSDGGAEESSFRRCGCQGRTRNTVRLFFDPGSL